MNGDYDVIDLLSILSIIMQLKIFEEQREQSTTDDLMNELQKQDKAYLERILENQKIIIAKLNKLT